MHRNTFVFVIFLAVLSAVIAGINISNRMHPPEIIPIPTPISQSNDASPTIPTEDSSTTEPANGKKQMRTYTNDYCGVSLSYDPSILKSNEEASDSATFTNVTNPDDTILLACATEIPRPPLTQENIETVLVASLSADLYHDSSAKDGTKIDAVIFTHPKNSRDILIAGYGKMYEELLLTVTVN
jgi:hypothetical protein